MRTSARRATPTTDQRLGVGEVFLSQSDRLINAQLSAITADGVNAQELRGMPAKLGAIRRQSDQIVHLERVAR
jgi:hypothetical protein